MNIQRRFLLLFLLVGVPAFAEEKVAQEQFAQTQLDQDQAGTLTLEAAIAQAKRTQVNFLILWLRKSDLIE